MDSIGTIIFFIASIAFVLALIFTLISFITYFAYVNNEERNREYIRYLKYALVSFLISGAALLLSAALCSYYGYIN